METTDKRLNSILCGLVRQNRDREMQAREAEPDPEGEAYQAMVDQANAEHAAREFLPELRAMPGREY